LIVKFIAVLDLQSCTFHQIFILAFVVFAVTFA